MTTLTLSVPPEAKQILSELAQARLAGNCALTRYYVRSYRQTILQIRAREQHEAEEQERLAHERAAALGRWRAKNHEARTCVLRWHREDYESSFDSLPTGKVPVWCVIRPHTFDPDDFMRDRSNEYKRNCGRKPRRKR